jgi:uncharacterized protein YcsI (UPF0317 family)
MDKFKMLIKLPRSASTCLSGYNASLTSREAGDLGGQMVKKMRPVRTVKFKRQNRIATGHIQTVAYITSIIL